MTCWLRHLLDRLHSSFANRRLDQDLDTEIAAHLELAVEETMRSGMSSEDAQRQARIRFGGVEQARQQHREARGFQGLDILWQDALAGCRSSLICNGGIP